MIFYTISNILIVYILWILVKAFLLYFFVLSFEIFCGVSYNVPAVCDVPDRSASGGRACALVWHFPTRHPPCPKSPAGRRGAKQKARERQRPSGAEPPTGGDAHTDLLYEVWAGFLYYFFYFCFAFFI
jgi:hypothetical protein